MKTLISVPDPVLDAVDRRARELGVARSGFFSAAAMHYMAELDTASLSARLDVAQDCATDDEIVTGVLLTGRRTLLSNEWQPAEV